MANIVHSLANGIHPGAHYAGSAPTPSQDHVLWVDTSSGPPFQLKVWDAGSSTWQVVGISSSGGAPASGISALSADLTMTLANTIYDGPSTTLAAGTWMLWAQATVLGGGIGNSAFNLVIRDSGGTAYGSAQAFQVLAQTDTAFCVARVSPGGSTLFKISAESSQAGSILKAQTTNPAGHGNNATALAWMACS